MIHPVYSLAIETSGRQGRIALGQGDQCLETRDLPEPKRHNLELIPTIDALLSQHNLKASDLRELYISLGPGSFTGLRIACSTAQMLALTNPKLKLVGVPTIDVLALQNASAASHIAVCLNIKRGTMYAGLYQAGQAILEPALRPLEELLEKAPPDVALISEVDLDHPNQLATNCAIADAKITWQVGHALAQQNQFTDPAKLLPRYIRQPEAVTMWEAQGKA